MRRRVATKAFRGREVAVGGFVLVTMVVGHREGQFAGAAHKVSQWLWASFWDCDLTLNGESIGSLCYPLAIWSVDKQRVEVRKSSSA